MAFIIIISSRRISSGWIFIDETKLDQGLPRISFLGTFEGAYPEGWQQPRGGWLDSCSLCSIRQPHINLQVNHGGLAGRNNAKLRESDCQAEIIPYFPG